MTGSHMAGRLGVIWLVITVAGVLGGLVCCRPALAVTDASWLTAQAGGKAQMTPAHGDFREGNGASNSMVTLRVSTVPAEPGVKLRFDGQQVTAGSDGIAVIRTPYQRTGHTLKLVTPNFSLDHGRIKVKFTVWRSPRPSQKHSTTLTHLILRRNHNVQLGFRLSYKVGLSFVTPDDRYVRSERVSGVELRASGGYVSSVNGGRTIRLLGVMPAEEAGILVARDVNYTLQTVIVDGSNVVNAGQQRVNPSRQKSAKFVLQLRQLTITAHDRLFGTNVGSAAVVTYPDGRRVTYRFGGSHQVVLTNLARGEYHVRILGSGLFTAQSVDLSRNQIINMPIFTITDIIVVAAIFAAVIIAAIVRQRRSRRTVHSEGPSG